MEQRTHHPDPPLPPNRHENRQKDDQRHIPPRTGQKSKIPDGPPPKVAGIINIFPFFANICFEIEPKIINGAVILPEKCPLPR